MPPSTASRISPASLPPRSTSPPSSPVPIPPTSSSPPPGRLTALPPAARVGTGSVRRAHQLHWPRPDLESSSFAATSPPASKSSPRKPRRHRPRTRRALERLGYTSPPPNRLECEASYTGRTSHLPRYPSRRRPGRHRPRDPPERHLHRRHPASIDHAPTHTATPRGARAPPSPRGDWPLP